MTDCKGCGGPLDADGYTTSECSWNPPAECEDCGACYCDGSC